MIGAPQLAIAKTLEHGTDPRVARRIIAQAPPAHARVRTCDSFMAITTAATIDPVHSSLYPFQAHASLESRCDIRLMPRLTRLTFAG
jgi:hypothetical protein